MNRFLWFVNPSGRIRVYRFRRLAWQTTDGVLRYIFVIRGK